MQEPISLRREAAAGRTWAFLWERAHPMPAMEKHWKAPAAGTYS